jgi:hypothetical protein
MNYANLQEDIFGMVANVLYVMKLVMKNTIGKLERTLGIWIDLLDVENSRKKKKKMKSIMAKGTHISVGLATKSGILI